MNARCLRMHSPIFCHTVIHRTMASTSSMTRQGEPRPLSVMRSRVLIRLNRLSYSDRCRPSYPKFALIPIPEGMRSNFTWHTISPGYQNKRAIVATGTTGTIIDSYGQIRHRRQRLMRIIMDLDTCPSFYRVPVEFPGESRVGKVPFAA